MKLSAIYVFAISIHRHCKRKFDHRLLLARHPPIFRQVASIPNVGRHVNSLLKPQNVSEELGRLVHLMQPSKGRLSIAHRSSHRDLIYDFCDGGDGQATIELPVRNRGKLHARCKVT